MTAPPGPSASAPLLLTGATGYVGGLLLRELQARGYAIRCLVREPERLRSRVSAPVEIVAGDVRDAASVERAMAGITTAFYLVHALGAARGFEAAEHAGAETFARAAHRAGVTRIIYLGGLGRGSGLSPHLATRQKVGEILRASGVPVVEFRAGMIIGAGSISFEILRALVGRLPVMITPRWTATQTQPIAIDDVLGYLCEAITLPPRVSEVYEIGGPDRVTYRQLLRDFARLQGLRRLILPVPLLTPHLSSLWLGLVTPVYVRVGRRLIEGLRTETVADTAAALRTFSIRPIGIREAMQRALAEA